MHGLDHPFGPLQKLFVGECQGFLDQPVDGQGPVRRGNRRDPHMGEHERIVRRYETCRHLGWRELIRAHHFVDGHDRL